MIQRNPLFLEQPIGYWLDVLRTALDHGLPEPSWRATVAASDLIRRGYDGQCEVAVDGISNRHLRRLLRTSGLPTPQSFFGLGRCLVTIHRLQNGRRISIEQASQETGWSDPSSFHRRCRTLFDARPGDLVRLNDPAVVQRMLQCRHRPARGTRPRRRRLAAYS